MSPLRNDSLGSAFRKLTARSSSIIPVVEDQRLIGIVTLQNLMHSMSLLAESRKLAGRSRIVKLSPPSGRVAEEHRSKSLRIKPRSRSAFLCVSACSAGNAASEQSHRFRLLHRLNLRNRVNTASGTVPSTCTTAIASALL